MQVSEGDLPALPAWLKLSVVGAVGLFVDQHVLHSTLHCIAKTVKLAQGTTVQRQLNAAVNNARALHCSQPA
jgi:hypothetical protein